MDNNWSYNFQWMYVTSRLDEKEQGEEYEDKQKI